MIIAIKIVLAILFFLCLANMPYGYYELVRFAGLIGFVYLAYQAQLQEKTNEVVVYIILALLFQPFFKLALGRMLWNAVDVVVGVGLIVSMIKPTKK